MTDLPIVSQIRRGLGIALLGLLVGLLALLLHPPTAEGVPSTAPGQSAQGPPPLVASHSDSTDTPDARRALPNGPSLTVSLKVSDRSPLPPPDRVSPVEPPIGPVPISLPELSLSRTSLFTIGPGTGLNVGVEGGKAGTDRLHRPLDLQQSKGPLLVSYGW